MLLGGVSRIGLYAWACIFYFWFKKKIRRRVVWYCPVSNHYIAKQKWGIRFFDPKIDLSIHFDLKYLENILGNLINSFIILKNHLKTQNQPKTKNLTKIIYVFLGNPKLKKHLMWTPIIKWNNLTQCWSFLGEIGGNKIFFFVMLDSDDFFSPLSSQW